MQHAITIADVLKVGGIAVGIAAVFGIAIFVLSVIASGFRH